MVQFWGKEEVRMASVQVAMPMKFCTMFPHCGDACLDDIACLAPAQKEIGQQSEEQVHAGGCQFGNALHAEVYGHGIHNADDHQDADGQEIVFR